MSDHMDNAWAVYDQHGVAKMQAEAWAETLQHCDALYHCVTALLLHQMH